jgi:hypothetical protein
MSADRQPSTVNSPQGRPQPRVFCFSLTADVEPGVIPRVLELFAKRSLVPQRCHSDVVPLRGGGSALSIDLQVAELTPELTDYIARCMRQIWGVETVLTSEKRWGEKRAG